MSTVMASFKYVAYESGPDHTVQWFASVLFIDDVEMHETVNLCTGRTQERQTKFRNPSLPNPLP